MYRIMCKIVQLLIVVEFKAKCDTFHISNRSILKAVNVLIGVLYADVCLKNILVGIVAIGIFKLNKTFY